MADRIARSEGAGGGRPTVAAEGAQPEERAAVGKTAPGDGEERPGIVERNRRAQKEKWALKAGK